MAGSQKRLKQLEIRLRSGKDGVVIETITSLRNQKPYEGVIMLLAELYNTSVNPMVRNLIREFMNDMKESSLRGEVMAEIKKDYKPLTVKMLIASCWQSGLDYSSWAPDFAMLFSTGDFETAIECFTVIESSANHISRKTKDHMIVILRENEDLRKTDKSALMHELVSVLA